MHHVISFILLLLFIWFILFYYFETKVSLTFGLFYIDIKIE